VPQINKYKWGFGLKLEQGTEALALSIVGSSDKATAFLPLCWPLNACPQMLSGVI
jgi:hypothetical protein